MTTPAKPDCIVSMGMPYYGPIEDGAYDSFYRPTITSDMAICTMRRQKRSATPACFNDLFCFALDDAADKGATHFAMLHSDIVPHPAWMALLYREMKAHQLVCVSAVAPLKLIETPTKTSTAIGPIADPWEFTRHITLDERETLPLTFRTADCCQPDEVLLINTGCMLIDLRHPCWATFPGFAFQTRIKPDPETGGHYRDPKTGAHVSQFLPEDWLMSRYLHKHSARYAATWAVPLSHVGPFNYRNH